MSQPASIFDAEDYSPMTDMTCQPADCEQCGAPYRRDAAYLVCTKFPDEHFRFCEPVGRSDHPKNAGWEAYLRANGLEAFDRAIIRHIQSHRF